MLQEELRDLEDSGIPRTLAEADPMVPPGAPNAADLYLRAFGLLPDGIDPIGVLFDPEQGRSAVEAAAPGLRLVHEAAALRDCAFLVDRTAYPWADETRSYRRDVRNAARWLSLEAVVRARDSGADMALESCADIFRLGSHYQEMPGAIPLMVGEAIYMAGAGAVAEALSISPPSPAACGQMFVELADLDQRRALSQALKGELAYGLDVYATIRHGDWATVEGLLETRPTPAWALYLYRTLGLPYLNLDEVTYIRYLRAWAEHYGEPSSTILTPGPSVKSPSEGGFPVADELTWSLGGVPRMARRAEAHIRATRIALAATAYKAAVGDYPSSLRELAMAGWDLPLDPFSEQSFHYQRQEPGFVVWSVGPNRKDDAGQRSRLSGAPAEDIPDDVVFQCER
jgi:hypothetical protein